MQVWTVFKICHKRRHAQPGECWLSTSVQYLATGFLCAVLDVSQSRSFSQSDTIGNDTYEKKQTYRRTDHCVRRVGPVYISALL